MSAAAVGWFELPDHEARYQRDLVTIVVPCLDEERAISGCLDALLCQTHRDIEILVVDGGSSDRTRELVAAYSAIDDRVSLLENPLRTQPAALNLAWSVAHGEFLARVDAHATVGPTYVEQVVAAFRSGDWGGVGGRKDAVGYTPTGRAIAAALASPFGVGNSVYHHGVSAQAVDHIPFGAYPTAMVAALGGWDENTPVNEDFEFDFRVRQSGRELLFDPSLVIAWEGRQTVQLLGRQYRRYGRGKSKVVIKHPRSMALRHLAPPALLAMLVLAAVVAPFRPKWAAALVAPYVGLVAVGTATIVPKLADTEERRVVPLALMAMHLPWGLGFWEGLAGAPVTQKRR